MHFPTEVLNCFARVAYWSWCEGTRPDARGTHRLHITVGFDFSTMLFRIGLMDQNA
jgi:hypothetical protein